MLSVDKYWTTLVRCAHLFEHHSFRTRFALSMVKALGNGFAWEPYHHTQSGEGYVDPGRVQKDVLLKICTFGGTGKSHAALKDLLEFITGSLAQPEIKHRCAIYPDGTRCCSSEADAYKKTCAKFLRLFGAGFTAPLLYRFKHYDSAQSYIRNFPVLSFTPCFSCF